MRLLKSIFVPIAVFFTPILRFLGALFLLGSVIALTADFSSTSHASGFGTLQIHMADFAPQTLAALKLDTSRSISSFFLRLYMNAPAFLSLGLTGALLLVLGRRRRQVRIYAN
ncbi:MAG: hypothetical protein RLZ98_36 [Pseudomonadota bacterium]